MCGSASKTLPAPPPVQEVPNRHRIRNAIRKVARTMKSNRTTDSWTLVDRVMEAGGWQTYTDTTVWSKTFNAVEKAVKNSTFFSKEEGICGSVKLTLRKSAQL